LVAGAANDWIEPKTQPDSSLRDTENVQMTEGVDDYFRREVLPHAPDAWIDESKTKTGYEIPFNRHFYVFEPPRDLAEIDVDLKHVTGRINRSRGSPRQWPLASRSACGMSRIS